MDGAHVAGLVDLVPDERRLRFGHEHMTAPGLDRYVRAQAPGHLTRPRAGGVDDARPDSNGAHGGTDRADLPLPVPLRPDDLGPPYQAAPVRVELADEEVDGRHGLDLAILLVEGTTAQFLGKGRLQLVQRAGGDQLDARSQLALRLGHVEQRFKFPLIVGHHQAALGLELDPVSRVSRLFRQFVPQCHSPQGQGQFRAWHFVGHEHVAFARRTGPGGRAQRSRRQTSRPAAASLSATAAPMMPAPTTSTSPAGKDCGRAGDSTTRRSAHTSHPGRVTFLDPRGTRRGRGRPGPAGSWPAR